MKINLKKIIIMLTGSIIPSFIIVFIYYAVVGYWKFNQSIVGILTIFTLLDTWKIVFSFAVLLLGFYIIYDYFFFRNSKFKIYPFSNLDSEILLISEGNNRYIWGIQVLNNTYRKDGKIKGIIDENNLDILYKRKEFLEKKISIKNDMVSCLVGLIVSANVAIISEGDTKVFLLNCFSVILFFVMLVIAVFIRVALPLDLQTHYNIYLYENTLIDKAISDIQNKLAVVFLDDYYLDTKEKVLSLLHKEKKLFQFHNKDIKSDIRNVEDMFMLKDSYAMVKKVPVKLKNGKDIYLMVDNAWNEKENIENYLIDEYNALYEILVRNELLAN